ncbi:MAG: adenylate kinase [Candidatus Anoxychlamydiales bacterium]|nr:adenylate kinase [Candidatus Anoxychlamydiales bacterium]
MENLYKSILIYGPPGAGKGTISKAISLSDSVVHVSTGEIFRGIDPSSEKGKMISSYINKGNLLPDDFTINVFKEFVAHKINEGIYDPKKQYLLLDGIPRTLKQAILLERYIKVEYIIILEMEDVNKLILRLKNRALIENRVDDLDDKVLENRIDIYLNDTTKILKHYSDDMIFNFNSDQKKLEVIRDVLIKFASILS